MSDTPELTEEETLKEIEEVYTGYDEGFEPSSFIVTSEALAVLLSLARRTVQSEKEAKESSYRAARWRELALSNGEEAEKLLEKYKELLLTACICKPSRLSYREPTLKIDPACPVHGENKP